MDASAKMDGMLAKEIEDELMKYTKKYDHKVEANLVVKTNDVQINSDVEVNITECTKSLGNELFSAELQDTTENSSSFEDCNSGVENVDAFGDSEASSDFRGDAAPALDFDGFGERFRLRRKKLTTHWRSFIHPLMWRCKWVELQIKKLQSRAQLYDRELEVYDEKKQTQLDNSIMIDGTKSLPFSQKNAKMDVFRRKKRRRTEATTDVTAYMSQHNLFSCYENKKCFTEGAFMNNELKNPANQKITTDLEILGDDELLSLDLGDGDNSIGQILLKIDFLQSEVGKLRSKFDRITAENAERISVAEKLDLLPPHSENGIEVTCIASQSTAAVVPQTGATSYVEVPVTSGSIDPACFEAYKPVEDGVLIDNQRVKEEMNSFEEVKIQQMPLVLKDETGDTTPSVIAEPGTADDQPPAKVRSIAKITGTRSKRKRGRKKAATSRRGRRSTG
ncbi:uncharacterized protein LOC131022835 [Salvia miltiorrhiza]|uniref:uncharacterized protein LOC131022835 n=1 Tax=Salvia miltiorrhiza TaxID=226208 RepID=UPI0025ABDDD8|nr:uncharacterized protein LOC131022835 [Salvia miltiorrhiza]XP_057808351.1 uncharacterized protein LOC131022835 [Salvia miltiorrhiza]XP_057808352.1 uncharacterized protein LOC131022835 [Salvia miltiorrhiza]XP_057808353.1 uncharacterized protein LOC131022835 [Salvia miltiorrhiza]